MISLFEDAYTILSPIEGFYSNDPDDPGGETKYGISKRQYPHLDIKNLTPERAKSIYLSDYWFKFKCNEIVNQTLAVKLFLAVVNINANRAIKLLQRACNNLGAELVLDGVIGSKTIGWINGFRYQKALISAFEGETYMHYVNQNKVKFIAGWLNRNYIRYKA